MKWALIVPGITILASLAWLGVYELLAFAGIWPTISSIVRPIVRSHIIAAVFIMFIVLGFLAGLIYDWFLSKGS